MKPIWASPISIEQIQKWAYHRLMDAFGVKFTEIGDDFLRATMPVDERTFQPMGSLHGGATCYLAETLGSIAANFCVNQAEKYCLGLEINVNHVKAARNGIVIATARALHLGKSTQIWDIQVRDEKGNLIAISRLTMAVLTKKPGS